MCEHISIAVYMCIHKRTLHMIYNVRTFSSMQIYTNIQYMQNKSLIVLIDLLPYLQIK
jgi:ABC-type molybdate transport system ATPase subunit